MTVQHLGGLGLQKCCTVTKNNNLFKQKQAKMRYCPKNQTNQSFGASRPVGARGLQTLFLFGTVQHFCLCSLTALVLFLDSTPFRSPKTNDFRQNKQKRRTVPKNPQNQSFGTSRPFDARGLETCFFWVFSDSTAFLHCFSLQGTVQRFAVPGLQSAVLSQTNQSSQAEKKQRRAVSKNNPLQHFRFKLVGIRI